MKRLILSVLCVLPPALQAETNYCHDPETNKAWEQIKRNHRGERDVEILVALRERLCREVDDGTLTIREATDRFEAERDRIIRERRKYNRGQDTRDVGVG